jgi:hypothetical protein
VAYLPALLELCDKGVGAYRVLSCVVVFVVLVLRQFQGKLMLANLVEGGQVEVEFAWGNVQ